MGRTGGVVGVVEVMYVEEAGAGGDASSVSSF